MRTGKLDKVSVPVSTDTGVPIPVLFDDPVGKGRRRFSCFLVVGDASSVDVQVVPDARSYALCCCNVPGPWADWMDAGNERGLILARPGGCLVTLLRSLELIDTGVEARCPTQRKVTQVPV